MIQGWLQDIHISLFPQDSCEQIAGSYGLSEALPGYSLIGLLGWDDFLLKSDSGLYTCPTVPIDPKYLQTIDIKIDTGDLRPDPELNDRIKWYITPLIIKLRLFIYFAVLPKLLFHCHTFKSFFANHFKYLTIELGKGGSHHVIDVSRTFEINRQILFNMSWIDSHN